MKFYSFNIYLLGRRYFLDALSAVILMLTNPQWKRRPVRCHSAVSIVCRPLSLSIKQFIQKQEVYFDAVID